MPKNRLAITFGLSLGLLIVLFAVLVWQPSQVRAQTATPTPAPGEPAAPSSEVVRTVSVSATGSAAAAPDQATISLGVRTQGETAEESLDENNEQMAALIATLREAGVASRDIQTSDFSIYPQYADSTNGTLRITGYEVSNRVIVTVRNLANFGEVLDAAVEAGGNQVDSIQFGFNDPAALLDQAREQAMAEAARKATQLATLADVQVGTVVSISESGDVPQPIFARGVMEQAADAAVPVEIGESAVSVTVQVTYELAP
jgi:uncharacterized protein